MTKRLRVTVRVIARAGRDEVGGMRDGALVVRVAARAVDGAANRAVAKALGKAARVAPSEVWIESGTRSRSKVVSLPTVAAARLSGRMK